MKDVGTKPHDALFRRVFSVPEHAAGELRHALAAELGARIDWSTLHLENDSMTDPALRELESDLIDSVAIDGHPAFVYVLAEHLSAERPLLGLRLLRHCAPRTPRAAPRSAPKQMTREERDAVKSLVMDESLRHLSVRSLALWAARHAQLFVSHTAVSRPRCASSPSGDSARTRSARACTSPR